MISSNMVAEIKVERAIHRHYTFTEKPTLPLDQWQQEKERQFPFLIESYTGELGFCVLNNGSSKLRKMERILFCRRPGKIITQRYVEHLCKELWFYLA